ncbi:hypothetical protein ACFWD3_08405, partial [Micrococcus luteus]
RAARTAFTDAYRDLLREAYPVTADGTTPFPFRRVFAVTTVPTTPAAQEGCHRPLDGRGLSYGDT